MPCYDPMDNVRYVDDAELAQAKREAAERGNVACEACRLLEAHGLLDQGSDSLKVWWRFHKADDDARQAAKAAERRKQALRAQALAKLTDAERVALGL